MLAITRERLDLWNRQWSHQIKLMSAYESGPGASGSISHFAHNPESLISEAERRIGRALPDDLKALFVLDSFQAAHQWSLPSGILLPFEDVFEGDLGWNLAETEFPMLFDENGEETEQRRYLSFYTAGNGDLLLLDLEHPTGSAVGSWSHEEDEFRLLAPSLAEFFDRITKLGIIGAHADAYLPFLGEDGLNPDGENGQIWQAWLKDYAELNGTQVKGDLPASLRLFEMIASDQAPRSEIGPLLLEQHTVEEILREWTARNENETSASNRRERLILIGDALGSAAAGWVRSLWALRAEDAAGNSAAPAPATGAAGGEDRLASERDAASGKPRTGIEAETSIRLSADLTQDVLHYLTAVCLPEEEGLTLVLREIEAQNSGGRMQPPYSLAAFRSRRIIPWMEPHVAFPIDGWASLLAASRPAAEDLIRWLRGADALRMTAVQAIGRLPEGELPGLFAGPSGEPERAELLRLLESLHASAVLRKEKAAIQEAIAAVSGA